MVYTAYNKFFQKRLPVVGSDWRGNVVYDDCMDEFAEVLRDRIARKRQNVVVVDGPTGSGKSTYAVELARAIDPKWKLRPNYIYDRKDLKAKLKCPQSPVSLFDEGSIVLNSKNVMRNDDKAIVALFDTMRSKGWTTIICMPSIASLNSVIRTYHVDYLCRMPSHAPLPDYDPRGFVKIYRSSRNEWSDKAHFSLCATSIFPPLSEDAEAIYQSVKQVHQNRLLAEFMEDDE